MSHRARSLLPRISTLMFSMWKNAAVDYSSLTFIYKLTQIAAEPNESENVVA